MFEKTKAALNSFFFDGQARRTQLEIILALRPPWLEIGSSLKQPVSNRPEKLRKNRRSEASVPRTVF